MGRGKSKPEEPSMELNAGIAELLHAMGLSRPPIFPQAGYHDLRGQ
jgi:hypothetical protein